MKMKRYLKILTLVICFSVMLFAAAFITKAASYNYDFWKNALPSAEGLTYKDTYYGEEIIHVSDEGEKTSLSFDSLEDMVIYENQIFLLDSRSNIEKKGTINGGEYKIKGASAIMILDQEMRCTTLPVDEFEITKNVYHTLKEFYGYKTSLSEIEASKFTLTDNLTEKPPYIPLSKESSIGEDSPEYSGASIILGNAKGIAVIKDGSSYSIYVADTDNSRIVKMNSDFVVTEVFLTPTDEVFYQWDSEEKLDSTNDTPFKPMKIAVDKTKRVYCIAKSVYEGIIEFSSAKFEELVIKTEENNFVNTPLNANGNFNRFLGKNVVTANPLKQFWYKIMSEAQINLQGVDLPPEFINLTIDADGFLYTTSYPDADDAQAKNMIKSINTSGKDVLRRNGYVEPNGDAVFLSAHANKEVVIGASTLTAIAVNPDGFYSVTDSRRGRIFTYDTEGNLLYITGEKGTLSNNINQPVALSYLTIGEADDPNKQELLLVVDKTSKSIISFTTSEFGKLVNEATRLYLNNKIIEAEDVWREVIKMNSNYELGYVGIGKSLLRNEQFEEAMEYFKLGHNAAYYSKAYQQYRDIVLKDNFNIIMSGLVITVLGLGILAFLKQQNRKKQGYVKEED